MKTLRWLAWPALGLLTVGAAEPVRPDIVLSRMRQAQASLRSLEAGLEQQKSYPQLGIEDPAETGRLFFSRTASGTRVKMDIETPEARILLVRDGHYLLYQPRIRQAMEGKLEGGGKTALFSGLLTGSPEALSALETDYDAESLGEDVLFGQAVTGLGFTAKPGAQVYCARIELWITSESWLPVRQSCHEANASVITFTLRDVKLNLPLPKGVFEVELPGDVERIRS